MTFNVSQTRTVWVWNDGFVFSFRRSVTGLEKNSYHGRSKQLDHETDNNKLQTFSPTETNLI